MSRFETEILTTRKNLKSLMDVPGKWIDRAGERRSLDKLILDLDNSGSETDGRRERPRYPGDGQIEQSLSHQNLSSKESRLNRRNTHRLQLIAWFGRFAGSVSIYGKCHLVFGHDLRNLFHRP